MPSHSGSLLAVIFLWLRCRLPKDPLFHPTKNEWANAADGANGPTTHSPAQLKTIQEVITLARAVFLIFKEW
jgi:hypothetical protein